MLKQINCLKVSNKPLSLPLLCDKDLGRSVKQLSNLCVENCWRGNGENRHVNQPLIQQQSSKVDGGGNFIRTHTKDAISNRSTRLGEEGEERRRRMTMFFVEARGGLGDKGIGNKDQLLIVLLILRENHLHESITQVNRLVWKRIAQP